MRLLRNSNLRIFGLLLLSLCCLPAAQAATTPTAMTITNGTQSPVFLNLVLGQPPTTLPANCTNLGQQIQALNDARLVFTSSVAKKTVSFTLVPSTQDKGSYQMAAGETITYVPQTFTAACASGTCSPALTLNAFFTPTDVGFSNNNGCSNSTFPNATNLAEVSINFGINGAVGTGCANADDTDISAVNGVNAVLEVSTLVPGSKTPQAGWPAATSLAKNAALGSNADLPGVFGWAATNCNGPLANSGFPNPSSSCAAPMKAPRLPAGEKQCKTPKGLAYAPIVFGGVSYCDERSDSGTCNNQRQGGVTGGAVAITYRGPLN